jgi:hypothetical protein
MSWRVPKKCSNCPFRTSGIGLHLRRSLRPGRWRGILDGLRRGEAFECHKTVAHNEDGDSVAGTGLMCAGAIEWLDRHSISNQFVRIMERIHG